MNTGAATKSAQNHHDLGHDHNVDEPEASHVTGYSRSYLRQARMRGRGPAYIRVGRSIRYRVSDLYAWVAEHRVETHSAAETKGRP